MENGIEIPIRTQLIIDGRLCIVSKGRNCSKCAIRLKYLSRTRNDGTILKCGTKLLGNTTDFLCGKKDRTDCNDIFFEIINKKN